MRHGTHTLMTICYVPCTALSTSHVIIYHLTLKENPCDIDSIMIPIYPRDEERLPSDPGCVQWWSFKHPLCADPTCVCSVQSCLTLCDSTSCSQPGSSVHGILLARILQWVAISSFRGSSEPRDPSHISCVAGGFLPLSHWGSPRSSLLLFKCMKMEL